MALRCEQRPQARCATSKRHGGAGLASRFAAAASGVKFGADRTAALGRQESEAAAASSWPVRRQGSSDAFASAVVATGGDDRGPSPTGRSSWRSPRLERVSRRASHRFTIRRRFAGDGSYRYASAASASCRSAIWVNSSSASTRSERYGRDIRSDRADLSRSACGSVLLLCCRGYRAGP